MSVIICVIITSAYFFLRNVTHVRWLWDGVLLSEFDEMNLIGGVWVDLRGYCQLLIYLADKHSFLLSLLDVRAAREQINLGGVTYPTLPLQDAGPRPQSMYGQASVACSPTVAFARPLPPHSSYFSGMTGPQHPFYNRVRQEEDRCQSDSKGTNQIPSWTQQPIIFVLFCLCIWSPICVFHFLFPSFTLPSLIFPNMCITSRDITPTMSPHLPALPLNYPVSLRTAPVDL